MRFVHCTFGLSFWHPAAVRGGRWQTTLEASLQVSRADCPDPRSRGISPRRAAGVTHSKSTGPASSLQNRPRAYTIVSPLLQNAHFCCSMECVACAVHALRARYSFCELLPRLPTSVGHRHISVLVGPPAPTANMTARQYRVDTYQPDLLQPFIHLTVRRPTDLATKTRRSAAPENHPTTTPAATRTSYKQLVAAAVSRPSPGARPSLDPGLSSESPTTSGPFFDPASLPQCANPGGGISRAATGQLQGQETMMLFLLSSNVSCQISRLSAGTGGLSQSRIVP